MIVRDRSWSFIDPMTQNLFLDSSKYKGKNKQSWAISKTETILEMHCQKVKIWTLYLENQISYRQIFLTNWFYASNYVCRPSKLAFRLNSILTSFDVTTLTPTILWTERDKLKIISLRIKLNIITHFDSTHHHRI